MTLSRPVTTFGFEMMPNYLWYTDNYQVQFILMSGATVVGTINVTVNGNSGSRLVAARVTGGGTFDKIVINGSGGLNPNDFAIGQVRYALAQPPVILHKGSIAIQHHK